MEERREGKGGDAAKCNNKSRVWRHHIPITERRMESGREGRAKKANAGGMLKEEMSCLTYLRMMHKSFKSISVLLKAWLKARHRVEVG